MIRLNREEKKNLITFNSYVLRKFFNPYILNKNNNTQISLSLSLPIHVCTVP